MKTFIKKAPEKINYQTISKEDKNLFKVTSGNYRVMFLQKHLYSLVTSSSSTDNPIFSTFGAYKKARLIYKLALSEFDRLTNLLPKTRKLTDECLKDLFEDNFFNTSLLDKLRDLDTKNSYRYKKENGLLAV